MTHNVNMPLSQSHNASKYSTCISIACVCVCVCVGMYMPSIVDSHQKICIQTMDAHQPWTSTVSEGHYQAANRIGMHVKVTCISRGRGQSMVVQYQISVRCKCPLLTVIFLECMSTVVSRIPRWSKITLDVHD